MKKNKEKTIKYNKGQIFTKIIAGILAFLMLLSVCITGIYYFYSYLNA